MIKLRDYQQTDYDKIIEQINLGTKGILLSAATGYGKSVIISHLANEYEGRVLVLTHRAELANQNSQLIEDFAFLNARTKKNIPLLDAKVVVCSAQTIIRRLEKYGEDYAGKFDLILIDEANLDYFKKVYDLIPHKHRLGLTATPIMAKKETKTVDGVEFVRQKTLAEEYDVLIQGISEQELIDMGFLTQDFCIQLTPPNLDKLIESNANPDGFTSKSLTEVFGSSSSIATVLEGYEKFCLGKKTLIFSPTTKVSLSTYDAFLKQGLNVKMFDSVNKQDLNRKEVVEWFKNTPDAILINVSIFGVGFSVNDLECIIYNKSTKSLQMFLQNLGRGSRIHPLKDRFLVLDLGLNFQRLGKWSDNRNWQQHFKPQVWKRKQASDLLQTWECHNCGNYNTKGELYDQDLDQIICPNCKTPKAPTPKNTKTIKGKFIILDKPATPSSKQIIDYILRTNGDANDAFKLTRNKLLDLFTLHQITPAFYHANRTRLQARTTQLFRPIYFAIISNPTLQGKNRRLETEVNRLLEAIDDLF